MGDSCWKCRQKNKKKEILELACRVCRRDFKQTRRAFDDGKRESRLPICPTCRRKEASVRLGKLRANQTVAQRSDNGKKARSMVRADSSETVRKQWDTIRSDSQKWKKAKDRLRDLSVKQWKNISDEDRNRRIKAFMGTHGKPRSKGNEELKRMMQDAGLYDGFISEEIFKGFIPDEINHDLRLVVEYYGDIYHCNPMRYEDPNQYVPAIRRTVGEQWRRDRRRLGVFYRCGYSVVVVWEKDFHRDPKREIERIRDEIDKKRATRREVR
jgi:G:T-mismatch repair DNA endonuclease (very short patch repair protein)